MHSGGPPGMREFRVVRAELRFSSAAAALAVSVQWAPPALPRLALDMPEAADSHPCTKKADAMESFRGVDPCITAHIWEGGQGRHTNCLARSQASCCCSHLCLLLWAHTYSMDASHPLTQCTHLHHQQEWVRCRNCGLAFCETSSCIHNGSDMLLRAFLPQQTMVI